MDQPRPLYATLPPGTRAEHRRSGTQPAKLDPIPDDLKGLLRGARAMGAPFPTPATHRGVRWAQRTALVRASDGRHRSHLASAPPASRLLGALELATCLGRSG